MTREDTRELRVLSQDAGVPLPPGVLQDLLSCTLLLFLELMKWMSLLAELQSALNASLASAVRLASNVLGSPHNFNDRPTYSKEKL